MLNLHKSLHKHIAFSYPGYISDISNLCLSIHAFPIICKIFNILIIHAEGLGQNRHFLKIDTLKYPDKTRGQAQNQLILGYPFLQIKQYGPNIYKIASTFQIPLGTHFAKQAKITQNANTWQPLQVFASKVAKPAVRQRSLQAPRRLSAWHNSPNHTKGL